MSLRYSTYFRELNLSSARCRGKFDIPIDFDLIIDDERHKDFTLKNFPEFSKYRQYNRLRNFTNLDQILNPRDIYCTIASRVRSIIPFFKVAYPDMIGAQGFGRYEPLNHKDRKVCRAKLLASVDRGLHNLQTSHTVIYDLDALIANQPRGSRAEERLGNWDETRRWKRMADSRSLHFESRFESGNLRKVIQVRIFEII